MMKHFKSSNANIYRVFMVTVFIFMLAAAPGLITTGALIETDFGKLREVKNSFQSLSPYAKRVFVEDEVVEIRSRIERGSPYVLVKCDFFDNVSEYYLVHEQDLMENTKFYDKHDALEQALGFEDEEEFLFLLSKFGKDYKKEYNGSKTLLKFLMNSETTILHKLVKGAWDNEYQHVSKLILDLFNENQKNEMMKFLLKVDDRENTAIFYACERNNFDFVKLFMEQFEEKEKAQLLESLMKENKQGKSCLSEILRSYDPILTQYVLQQFDDEKGVEFLMNIELNGETRLLKSMRESSIWFSQQNIKIFLKTLEKNVKKEKLHDYLMQSDQNGKTALHEAIHENTLYFILQMFDGKKDYKTLIDFIMKTENRHGRTMLHEFSLTSCDEGNFDKKIEILFSKLHETNQEEKIIQFMDMMDKHGASALGKSSITTNEKLQKLRLIHNKIWNSIFKVSQFDEKFMGKDMHSIMRNFLTY